MTFGCGELQRANKLLSGRIAARFAALFLTRTVLASR